MKFSGMTAVSYVVAWILRFIKINVLRMRSEKITYQANLQPDFFQIQNKNLGQVTGVYSTFKINRYSNLEKNDVPEVDSNHNEERITNPCGYVTHIHRESGNEMTYLYSISPLS